jgi:hypothetical protein|eukprot:5069306-Prymnesium_polylepis.2
MYFAADANPIKAFARRGETTLHFPASHTMNRFTSALSSFALLGKLGDEVSFRNLPTSVQNAEVASAFDALVVAELSESCGSPGEVGNNPLAGHPWKGPHGNGAVGGMEQTYFAIDNGYHGFGQIVHFRLALHAPDQLRQRAAHALLQVYVMSFLGTDHNWNSEVCAQAIQLGYFAAPAVRLEAWQQSPKGLGHSPFKSRITHPPSSSTPVPSLRMP